MKNFKPIAQKHSMGCGVACVASLLGITYMQALKLFDKRRKNTRGYYLKHMKLALRKGGYIYKSQKIKGKKKRIKMGFIAFIGRSKKFPFGHYLLKTNKGWMNPWVNIPNKPIKADFQKRLPGKTQWVLSTKFKGINL